MNFFLAQRHRNMGDIITRASIIARLAIVPLRIRNKTRISGARF